MKRMRLFSRAAVLPLVLALSMVAPAVASACTCPTLWADDCVNIAASGIGSWYHWGWACWKTWDREWGGADCSGYVVKGWQVPRASATTENYHPYGTWHLFCTTTHWYPISRGSAWRSDAIGYPDPDGDGPASGHVVMYRSLDPWGTALVYEAPHSNARIQRVLKDVSASKWLFRRRHNLLLGYPSGATS
jgi:hypothetical protein